jgi:hypothetical protein
MAIVVKMCDHNIAPMFANRRERQHIVGTGHSKQRISTKRRERPISQGFLDFE